MLAQEHDLPLATLIKTPSPDFRFYGPHPLAPIASLEELRRMVLDISITRCPKWRFRLADDCVVQLQPRPKDVLFKGIVIRGEHLPATVFRQPLSEDRTRVKFYLTEGESPRQWWVRPERLRGAQRWHTANHKALLARTLLQLPMLSRLTPEIMLESACLSCGKRLVDSASRARWIEPECARTSALDAVRAWRLPAEHAA